MLRPSAFTWYWQKVKNCFSFWGKRALCSKKVFVVKFLQKRYFFLSDHFSHKSLMTMVFWQHICNCLAYMASLAKKYFGSNVLNQLLLIAERGTYAKMIYVEKIIIFYVFQRYSKKFKLSRNRILIIVKSPLKNAYFLWMSLYEPHNSIIGAVWTYTSIPHAVTSWQFKLWSIKKKNIVLYWGNWNR